MINDDGINKTFDSLKNAICYIRETLNPNYKDCTIAKHLHNAIIKGNVEYGYK